MTLRVQTKPPAAHHHMKADYNPNFLGDPGCFFSLGLQTILDLYRPDPCAVASTAWTKVARLVCPLVFLGKGHWELRFVS